MGVPEIISANGKSNAKIFSKHHLNVLPKHIEVCKNITTFWVTTAKCSHLAVGIFANFKCKSSFACFCSIRLLFCYSYYHARFILWVIAGVNQESSVINWLRGRNYIVFINTNFFHLSMLFHYSKRLNANTFYCVYVKIINKFREKTRKRQWNRRKQWKRTHLFVV